MVFMENLIKIGLSILLLLCLLDMPYGYYQFVRFLGMICFGFLAFKVQQTNQGWFVFWLASAILINPLFKISLGRTIWNIVDVVWAIALIVSIKNSK
jgi:uncharacterized membrane protein